MAGNKNSGRRSKDSGRDQSDRGRNQGQKGGQAERDMERDVDMNEQNRREREDTTDDEMGNF